MYPYDFKDLVRKKVKSTSEYARGREYFVFSTDTTISTTVSTKPVIQQTFKSKRKISIEKIHFFPSDPNSFCFAYRIQALLESDIIELMNTIFLKTLLPLK